MYILCQSMHWLLYFVREATTCAVKLQGIFIILGVCPSLLHVQIIPVMLKGVIEEKVESPGSSFESND